ncbi:MAG: winged helix-turn-helix transcriptional regulator [Ruminococcaceae bacterium]|nr:winged helix-turn-helix transcriptional regulator [Oscillospiraceae bacterium]
MDIIDLPQTISLLHRKTNMGLNARLKEIGLSYAQARLLKHLSENSNMIQTDLCNTLGLDKSTVAKLLGRMEDSGLITKSINPEDIRSHLVSLTPKAVELLPKIEKVLLGWNEDVTSSMEEVDREIFYELIDKVARQAETLSENSLHATEQSII